jgi:hypothetical protein
MRKSVTPEQGVESALPPILCAWPVCACSADASQKNWEGLRFDTLKLMAKNRFEAAFCAFVTDFGGEVLPEDQTPNRHSADYFFRKYNIVAELKCLMVDQTHDTRKKLGDIIEQRFDPSPPFDNQPSQFRLLSCEPTGEGGAFVLRGIRSNGEHFTLGCDEIEREWAKVLLSPIESIIRDANRQISHTKDRLNVPSANGVVLIFNESNHLHTGPQHFGRLAGEVIQKPKAGAERKFPHIQGMVYFSLGAVTTSDEQTGKDMQFWMPAQVAGEHVEQVKLFQDDLKRGWFQYVDKMTGTSVVSHHRETGWPEPGSD